MKLYYDNKPTINMTHNSVQHDRTKQVGVGCHFIKENQMVGWYAPLMYPQKDR